MIKYNCNKEKYFRLKFKDHVTCRCSAALTSNMFNFAKPTSKTLKGDKKTRMTTSISSEAQKIVDGNT